eukprot:TRINITY_DN994_c0_g2_i2.p1 TRINITY_DN994_c0_g2~~TRINITY_DN994_c0_g2_i2.p1  ORF type:complete len:112 (-),score=18.18 TRINITY_DN994_c0_g2_i2:74-409(-)
MLKRGGGGYAIDVVGSPTSCSYSIIGEGKIEDEDRNIKVVAWKELNRDCEECGGPAEVYCGRCGDYWPSFHCNSCFDEEAHEGCSDSNQDISDAEVRFKLTSPRFGSCGFV